MHEEPASETTRLLIDWSAGDEEALDELMPRVYHELERIASAYLRRERVDHTLQTSALVNEAYLRLVDQRRVRWQNRAHFFALAAHVMRRILVDHARRHVRRPSGAIRLPVDDAVTPPRERPPDLEALDHALRSLEAVDPDQAKIVELRYFGGLKAREIAEVTGLSTATVGRRWRLARAWLYRELSGGLPDAP